MGDINIMNGKIVGWGGSIYCDSFDPIFSSDFWNIDTYKDAFPEIRYLEPMTCQEADRKNIPEDDMIAEKKWDGHRTLMFIGEEHNRFFSRRLSKKTDWYSESSDNLLHLRDFPIPSLKGTVLDAELTMPTFADVQGVTGALPETALQNQIEKGFADINVFDILYYNGVRVERYPLYIRKIFLLQAIKRIWHPSIKQATFYVTKVMQKKFIDAVVNAGYGHLLHELPMDIVPSYKQLLKDMWNVGDEGLILKKYDSIYEEQRTKTWLKLKDMKYRDVVIMDYQDPTIWYDGKSLDEKGTWGYWADAEDETAIIIREMSRADAESEGLLPVTKPWAMGWIGAIICGCYNKKGKLVKVAEVKGISDQIQEYIKAHKKALINKRVLEIKFQDFISTDPKSPSVRHPRYHRMRDDMTREDCTIEYFLREGD